MLLFIISSLVLVFVCAWMLSQPFRVNRTEQEAQAQQGQYVLARERLLQQLEQIDTQASEGLLEKESANGETARLEYELAGVLKSIDTDSETYPPTSVNNTTKLNSWFAFSGFSLLLLIGSFVLYGSWQVDTLLSLLQVSSVPVHQQTTLIAGSEPSSTSIPPQALAMVTRLEGKLAKNPDDGQGWKRLGRSYMVMGRYKDAVSAYSLAAELLPNDEEIKQAMQELAEIASPQRQAEQQVQAVHPKMTDASQERIIQLQEKLAAKPDDAMNWARLGRTYLNIQRMTDAEHAYARAYSLEPGNIVILSSYARLIYSQDPHDPDGRALELFKKLHALDPEHPDGLWFLGLAAERERDYERAIELWTKLLNILHPDSEGYVRVSGALTRAEALSNIEK